MPTGRTILSVSTTPTLDREAAARAYEADGYLANSGDRLVAFTVSLTEPSSDGGPFANAGPTLTLTVRGAPEGLPQRLRHDSQPSRGELRNRPHGAR